MTHGESRSSDRMEPDECNVNFCLPIRGQVAGLRSASRAGFLDFAVNAKRVNWFATALGNKGWSTVLITPDNHADYFRQNGSD